MKLPSDKVNFCKERVRYIYTLFMSVYFLLDIGIF